MRQCQCNIEGSSRGQTRPATNKPLQLFQGRGCAYVTHQVNMRGGGGRRLEWRGGLLPLPARLPILHSTSELFIQAHCFEKKTPMSPQATLVSPSASHANVYQQQPKRSGRQTEAPIRVLRIAVPHHAVLRRETVPLYSRVECCCFLPFSRHRKQSK